MIVGRVLAGGLLAIGAAVLFAGTGARASEKLPAASRFYSFVGHWKGVAKFSETGKQPASLAISMTCSRAASGWAVRCEMVAKNDKMTMTESDLFGVDAVTGQAHWYAITNQGDAHDHLVRWTGAKTMKAHHSWAQGAKRMREDITLSLPSKNTMTFHSVVTADGTEVNQFSGSMAR